MSDVPDEWREYARLQSSLENHNSVDGQSWGLEAALDHSLDKIQAKEAVEDPERESNRVIANPRGREHHRRVLRLVYIESPQVINPEPALEARSELRALVQKAQRHELMLLLQSGLGYDASEGASALGITPVAWR